MDNFNEITFIPVMLTKKTSSFNLAKKKIVFRVNTMLFVIFSAFFLLRIHLVHCRRDNHLTKTMKI